MEMHPPSPFPSGSKVTTDSIENVPRSPAGRDNGNIPAGNSEYARSRHDKKKKKKPHSDPFPDVIEAEMTMGQS